MKSALINLAMFVMIIFVGCSLEPAFPLFGTWTGTATINGEASDLTLVLEGEYEESLFGDSWDITGTIDVWEWENALITRGYYSPTVQGDMYMTLEAGYIGQYFLGIESAIYEDGEISGVIAKCTQNTVGQVIGTFTVTQ